MTLTFKYFDDIGVVQFLHVVHFTVQPLEHTCTVDVLLANHLESDLQKITTEKNVKAAA